MLQLPVNRVETIYCGYIALNFESGMADWLVLPWEPLNICPCPCLSRCRTYHSQAQLQLYCLKLHPTKEKLAQEARNLLKPNSAQNILNMQRLMMSIPPAQAPLTFSCCLFGAL